MRFNVAKDFTKYMGGRYKKFGPKSGEELRDDFLIPMLKKNPEDFLFVDLTDVMVCWATLEEIFGGLVRKMGPKVADRIRIIGDDDDCEAAHKFMQDIVEHYGEPGWV